MNNNQPYKWCRQPSCGGLLKLQARYCRFCAEDLMLPPVGIACFDHDGAQRALQVLSNLCVWLENSSKLIGKLPDSSFKNCLETLLEDLDDPADARSFMDAYTWMEPPSAGFKGLVLELFVRLCQAGDDVGGYLESNKLKVIGVSREELDKEIDYRQRVLREPARQCPFCLEYSLQKEFSCKYCGSDYEVPAEKDSQPLIDKEFVREVILHFAARHLCAGGELNDRYRQALAKNKIPVERVHEECDSLRSRLRNGGELEIPLCAWARRLRHHGLDGSRYNESYFQKQTTNLRHARRFFEAELMARYTLSNYASLYAETQDNAMAYDHAMFTLCAILEESGQYADAEDLLLQRKDMSIPDIAEGADIQLEQLTRFFRTDLFNREASCFHNLGSVCLKQGKLDKAEMYLRQCLSTLRAGDSISREQCMDLLIDVYLQSGKTEQAEELLQDRLQSINERQPNQPPPLLWSWQMARLRWSQGAFDDAELHFHVALNRCERGLHCNNWPGFLENALLLFQQFQVFLYAVGNTAEASRLSGKLDEISTKLRFVLSEFYPA